jgi:hypothetical protein
MNENQHVASVLINLSPEQRAWVMANVAPMTFTRWCRMITNRAFMYGKDSPIASTNTIKERIDRMISGTETLDGLEVWELDAHNRQKA